MKNKKKIIVTVIQIFLILLFAFVYKQYVSFSLQPTYVLGYSSAFDKSGHKVKEADLVKIPMSQSTVSSSMFTVNELNQVVGKYTKIPVVGKSIIYKTQLGDVSTVDKFSSLDLSNSRVISLPITYVNGVAGDFKKGDRVDLMYSLSGASADTQSSTNTSADSSSDKAQSGTNTGKDSSFTYAKIFMQNIPVYQVNTGDGYAFTPHADKDQNETVKDKDGKEVQAKQYAAIASISIIVTPEQAEEIAARQKVGTLTFVKRFDESENHETLGFVIGKYGKVFAGNGNAETGNVQIADAFIKSDLNDNTLTDKSESDSDSSNSSSSGSSNTVATGDENVK